MPLTRFQGQVDALLERLLALFQDVGTEQAEPFQCIVDAFLVDLLLHVERRRCDGHAGRRNHRLSLGVLQAREIIHAHDDPRPGEIEVSLLDRVVDQLFAREQMPELVEVFQRQLIELFADGIHLDKLADRCVQSTER